MTERGNNLFVDEDGGLIFWGRLQDGGWLEIEFQPKNSPALSIHTTNLDPLNLAKHINLNLLGWYARKCNIDGVNLENGYVVARE
jgi:hypothetical protein